MTRFTVTVETEDVVEATRDRIWGILTDPDKVAELTPRLSRIDVKGDRWVWVMTGFNVLGVSFEPSFTEAMSFIPKEHIRFEHAPTGHARENAGANGEYRLSDHEDGTRLWIKLIVHVDLPLPKMAGGAVRAIMQREVDKMGDGFAANMRAELDATAPAAS